MTAISETAARRKWCPMVRVEGGNRLLNLNTDGFDAEHKYHHRIASDCMGWRAYHLSYHKGGEDTEQHGYCGIAGRSEVT